MKVHHLAVAAMLLGTGWSTNVVYEYQTGQSLWRGVASQEVTITIDNASAKIDELESAISDLKTSTEEVIAKSKEEGTTLSKLIEIRDNDLKDLRTLTAGIWDLQSAIHTFILDNDGQAITELSERVSALRESLQSQSSEFAPELNAIDENIKRKIEEKTLAQQQMLDDLSSNICEQNRTLSSLTSKIEELLKDKKKVVDAADDEDESKDEDRDASLARTLAMMNAFSSQFTMTPSAFFNAPAPIGLQSTENPLGIDMNFLMMTNMLTGSNGFGPRANINYAPVYNQQRTYYGMPSLTNFGRDAILGNTLFDSQSANANGINPGYLQAIQGNLNSENGPIFNRGNGLQGAFNFN